jgi:integrase
MKKNGIRDTTIKNVKKMLTFLAKNVSLEDSERIKDFIAKLNSSEGYKRNLAFAYQKYAECYGISWNKPKYKLNSKLPKIPLEEKINMIIANSSRKLALAISMSRDTGLRAIELMNLKLKDIDLDKGLVYPETAKHGSSRVLKLKPSTLNLLLTYLEKHKEIGLNDKIFGNWNSEAYGKYFRATRNRTAEKVNDSSIKGITLHSLRHFFASRLYHQTNNILLVKQLLGHKKIETTLIYVQLIDIKEDEYICNIAKTIEEAQKLVENGFEYVCDVEDVKLFRKRK